MAVSGARYTYAVTTWLVGWALFVSAAFVWQASANVRPVSFTAQMYNVTVAECAGSNQCGRRVYASSPVRMGIPLLSTAAQLADPSRACRYRITSTGHDRTFRLEPRLVGNFCFLFMRVRTDIVAASGSSSSDLINRERMAEYEVLVRAEMTDVDGTQYSPTTLIRVVVTDVNDAAPLFERPEYSVEVPESLPAFSEIARVLATDSDIGANAEVFYSLASHSELFYIHPTTGVVYLMSPLHPETDHELSVRIVAQNSNSTTPKGSFPQRGHTILKVKAKQVNDRPPEFEVKQLVAVSSFTLSNTTVALVTVRDRDRGMNGQIDHATVVLIDKVRSEETPGIPVTSLFSLERRPDESTYALTTIRPLRSIAGLINVTVQAWDRGLPPLWGSVTIPIFVSASVTGLDEHVVSVSVNETAPMLMPVAHVHPIGTTGSCAYAIIHGNSDHLFAIHNRSGVLFVLKELDAEKLDSVNLKVQMTCKPAAAPTAAGKDTWLTETHEVAIAILDCNDNAPVFVGNTEDVLINEDAAVGSSVLRATAKDIDSGENGMITYALMDNDVPFRIDPITGLVTLTEALDYDRGRRRYWLRVRASDQGHPFRRETEATYSVSVVNKNDNQPMFEKLDCTVSLSTASRVGTSILTASALDLDEGTVMEYMLNLVRRPEDCFALDPMSGALRVTCPLTYSQGQVYNLELQATDGKFYSAPLHVVVTVLDARQMNGRDVSVDCRESEAKRNLDDALRDSEKNNAAAAPLVQPQTKANLNLEAPRFSSSSRSVQLSIVEDTAVGSVINVFSSTDPDVGFGGIVNYAIVSGNVEGRFYMNPETGQLSVFAPLDRETVPGYQMTLVARDRGQPSRSSSVTVVIRVLDANDNAPQFVQPSYTAEVLEGTKPGTLVLQVGASDPDEGDNGQVVYELIGGNVGNAFSIERTTGVLSVRGLIDREVCASYMLEVVARDSAKASPQSASIVVVVTVSDVNDNAPAFLHPIYRIKVREDLPVGTVITRISASDPDLGDGGLVSYSFKGGSGSSGKFSIDRTAGVVRIADELDYEHKNVHMLAVRARDSGSEKLESSCQLEVHVVDVNENLYAPLFDELVYEGTVKENAPLGTVVLKVTATDEDRAVADRTIAYSIRDGSGLGRFSVNASGFIKTTTKLDRESQSSYWLVVYAQDGGTVPLVSSVEVYITVQDENDNAPRAEQIVYYASVPENQPAGAALVTIKAHDEDDSTKTSLTYSITARNALSLFTINGTTGTIRTTKRRLDRESASEHMLEVTINDNGSPPLSSTVFVIIKIEDENDEAPVFQDQLSVIHIPAMHNISMPFYQVFALDKDAGANGTVTYMIEQGGPSWLSLDSRTGQLYATAPLQQRASETIVVTATDGGSVPRSASKTLEVVVTKGTPAASSLFASQLLRWNQEEGLVVNEKEVVGSYLGTVRAREDESSDIFYAISGGDGCFAVNPERGDLFLSRPLDFERQRLYNVTIAALDGTNSQSIELSVRVVDHNEFRPEFSKPLYNITVPESIPVGTAVLQVAATDADGTDLPHYTIHRVVLGGSFTAQNSAQLFRIDPHTGVISTAAPLDHEETQRHELVIMVSDLKHQHLLVNYARVFVHVTDHNDHAPVFSAPAMNVTVSETAAVGTAVVQVAAYDRDKGVNAEITYSIVAGNIGYTFDIESQLGLLRLAKDIDLRFMKKYDLIVRATDHGVPQQKSDVKITIDVIAGEERMPVFSQSTYAAEVAENEPPGSFVLALSPVSLTTVFYSIVSGTGKDVLEVDAHSGVITTSIPLDYEELSTYTVVVEASSVTGSSAQLTVLVTVLDRNDNRPAFLHTTYTGRVSEAAPDGSAVLGADSSPLMVLAIDRDSNLNSLLAYRIVEESARQHFAIDIYTGALRTVVTPDREARALYTFTVQVSDQALDLALAAELPAGTHEAGPGEPSLSALDAATVIVHIEDANDTPPLCEQSPYRAVLLVPTYVGVVVATVRARDPDEEGQLTYSLQSPADTGVGRFSVDSRTGDVRVASDMGFSLLSTSSLAIGANDGLHAVTCSVVVEYQAAKGLSFSRRTYSGDVPENSTAVRFVALVQVFGTDLNEPIVYELVTERGLFQIGRTSGVVSTRGVSLDREAARSYNVVVRAVGTGNSPKINQTVVVVTVTDVNDNAPTFVHLPYHASVPVDASIRDIVTRVIATDRDEDQNSAVQYELLTPGPFQIGAKIGEIYVATSLTLYANRQFDLVVRATDNGEPRLSSTAAVIVKVVTKSTPTFGQPQYSVSVKENVPIGAAILTVEATSPLRNKILYSISSGDNFNEFTIQFSTGAIRVNDDLDYEAKKSYELTVRALDVSTGDWADAMVKINIEDVNDQSPFFERADYFVVVSEALAVGSEVATIQARDSDSGLNALLHYSLRPTVGAERDVELFSIDAAAGVVRSRSQLDHERAALLRFDVVATDGGSPRLSAVAHVHVELKDVNDNPPRFDEPLYRTTLSGGARRGQLVAMVTATDADVSDSGRLSYAIISGNAHRAFVIEPFTGALTLSALHEPPRLDASLYTLNISATDGRHTSFATVVAVVRRPNQYAPRFQRTLYNIAVPENMASGTGIGTVHAVDDDDSSEGGNEITYAISGELMQAYFQIDANTGELSVAQVLDHEKRQLYHLVVEARDSGGRVGFTSVYVSVTDLNDEPPLFKCQDYRVAVPLTCASGTEILQVTATDNDGNKAVNARIRYEMIPGDELSHAAFVVDVDRGIVRTVADLSSFAGQTMQFYIRAMDGAQGSMIPSILAPVSVYIMRENELVPEFAEQNPTMYINETTAPGTVVKHMQASIRAQGIAAELRYRIVPGMTESTNKLLTFSIGTTDGRVTLVRPVDAEAVSRYELTVEVTSSLELSPSAPTTVSRTTLVLLIFDDNDNAPMFSSALYHAPVPEDVLPGTKILQLYAEDSDIEDRKAISYSLAPESSSLSGVFMVDSNGAVFMLAPIDREKISTYEFKVVASDQDWRGRSLSSTASVIVQVLDVNDEPPRFTEVVQEVAVHEDAPIGTVVIQLHTADADLPENTHIVFSITDGNNLGHFRIRSHGEIYVNKPLDRESIPKFDLEVAASDSIFVTKVRLVITILDANDNAPLCFQPLYTKVISEDTAVPTVLLRVQAKDVDEPDMPHSRITYLLSGDWSEDFAIDSATGYIHVRRELDRERYANYRLTARAQDGGGLYCTMDVAIYLTDVNDNDPVFDQSEYQWTLPEDSPNNTLLMRVSATDKDSGINRKISYYLASGGDGRFAVDDRTGIVRVTGSLRREVAHQYVLTVGAIDHGLPRRAAQATFVVDIADVNDPPRFELSIYEQHLREDTPVGTSVMSVRATSADMGPNNIVSYRITDAGADTGLFVLDKATGTLRTAGTFDYERVREYVLTIEAKDDGEPPLSDRASVKIHITDSNDNSPQFSQHIYKASVREDAKIRDAVVRVQAMDADSGINSALTYAIIGGDELKQFAVDRTSGHITVAASLDREAIASYLLSVRAEDGGFPSKSSTVNVEVYIVDVNDNSPRFSQSNYTAILQEGKNAAYSPLRFDVTDADAPPNSGPFEFSIVSGAADKFLIRGDGSLLAPGHFLMSEQSEYVLHVRVSDGGTPSLSSDAIVIVRIVEATLQPPEVSPAIVFHVKTFESAFPAGAVVGRVIATDPDGDQLMFSVGQPSDPRKLFSVDAQKGVVSALSSLDEGRYGLTVSVSDGRFTTSGQVDIIVSAVSTRLLAEALAIRFVGIDLTDFITSHQHAFVRAVRDVAPVPLAGVHILAVQQAVVQLPPVTSANAGSTIQADVLRRRRSETSAEPQSIEALVSLERMSDRAAMPREQFRSLIDTQRLTIESIMGGSLRLDAAGAESGPCQPQLSMPLPCRDDERCHLDYRLDDATVVVASLKESFTSFSFRPVARCVCNADSCSNPCQSSPCPAPKICRPLASSTANQFACECPENRFGSDCKLRVGDPLAFTGMSYAVWELTHSIEKKMRLTLRFRTMQKDAVLMDARGKVDFSILEIEDGKLQYRFECGSGIGKLRIENVAVDDGRWHTVDVERVGNFAKLVLDIPYTVQAFAPGTTDVINLNNKDVYFGGTPKGRDNVERGFRGCMSDIRVEAEVKIEGDLLLPYGKPNSVGAIKKFQHIQFGCNKIGHCEPNPCLNDGICLETPGGSTCSCKGYSGAQCEYDLDECTKSPCLNGGLCTNLVGSFQCDCLSGFSGGLCEVSSYPQDSLSVASPGFTLGTMEIIVIAAAACGLLLLAVVVAVVVRCVTTRKRRRKDDDTGRSSAAAAACKLGSADIFHPHSGSQSSLAEDDGERRSLQPPSIPPRPTSYTSSVHDSTGRQTNIERVRSYGSAADGLENLQNVSIFSPDFKQCVESTRAPMAMFASIAPNLPALPSSAAASDTDSIQKPLYEFDYPNIYGSAACNSRTADESRRRDKPAGARYKKDDSVPSLSATDPDDEAYHWDTSDWDPQKGASRRPAAARREVGNMRIPHRHLYPPGYQSSDLGEDSEYVGDSEPEEDDPLFAPRPPSTDALLKGLPSLQHDYNMDDSLPQFNLPSMQPSQYLPEHRAPSAGGDSECSGSGGNAAARESRRIGMPDFKGRTFVPLGHSGSSPAVPKRSASLVGARGDYRHNVDEMSSLAGGGNEYLDSDSDMSGICEIESDYEPNVAGIIPSLRAPSHTDV